VLAIVLYAQYSQLLEIEHLPIFAVSAHSSYASSIPSSLLSPILTVGRVCHTGNELSPLGTADRQYSFPIARFAI
jgi:hypothetical protein